MVQEAHGRALVIVCPEDADLGPKMLALNPRQRLFVCAFFEQPGSSHTNAARLAGYEGDEKSLGVQGYRLFHAAAVQEAIMEETHRRFRELAPIAEGALRDILNDKLHRDRVKAIKLVLERTGFHAKQELLVTKTTKESRLDQLQKVVSLAKQIGVDPKTLLGDISDVTPEELKLLSKPAIDAEFTEVHTDDPWCGEPEEKKD